MSLAPFPPPSSGSEYWGLGEASSPRAMSATGDVGRGKRRQADEGRGTRRRCPLWRTCGNRNVEGRGTRNEERGSCFLLPSHAIHDRPRGGLVPRVEVRHTKQGHPIPGFSSARRGFPRPTSPVALAALGRDASPRPQYSEPKHEGANGTSELKRLPCSTLERGTNSNQEPQTRNAELVTLPPPRSSSSQCLSIPAESRDSRMPSRRCTSR